QAAGGRLPAADRQLYRTDEAGAVPRRENGRRPGLPTAIRAAAGPFRTQRSERIRSQMKERTMTNLACRSKLLVAAAAVLALQACATTCPDFDSCLATSPRLD